MTEEKVVAYIAKYILDHLNPPIAVVTAATRLADGLNLDSLDVIELVMELEREFVVALPDAEIERCATVGDLARLVCR